MSAIKNVINDNYNNMLLNDYLKEKIKDAGYASVNISKVPSRSSSEIKRILAAEMNIAKTQGKIVNIARKDASWVVWIVPKNEKDNEEQNITNNI